MSSSGSSFSLLRLVAGAIFVLAGILAFYGLGIGYSAITLLFVIAGAAVILIAVARLKVTGGDVALFVIAIIVLALVTAGSPSYSGTKVVTYTLTRAELGNNAINQLVLSVSVGLGSTNIQYSDNSSLVYEVTFTRTFLFFPLYSNTNSDYVLSNHTANGILFLNATSSTDGVDILLGKGYRDSILAAASTGSVQLSVPQTESLGNISLSSSTGSVDASISAGRVSSITLHADTGSVSLRSDSIAPAGARVPISVSASTGSVNVELRLPRGVSVALNASNSLGSISQNLPGFTISQSSNNNLVAFAGNTATADESFLVNLVADTGSINVNIQFNA